MRRSLSSTVIAAAASVATFFAISYYQAFVLLQMLVPMAPKDLTLAALARDISAGRVRLLVPVNGMSIVAAALSARHRAVGEFAARS